MNGPCWAPPPSSLQQLQVPILGTTAISKQTNLQTYIYIYIYSFSSHTECFFITPTADLTLTLVSACQTPGHDVQLHKLRFVWFTWRSFCTHSECPFLEAKWRAFLPSRKKQNNDFILSHQDTSLCRRVRTTCQYCPDQNCCNNLSIHVCVLLIGASAAELCSAWGYFLHMVPNYFHLHSPALTFAAVYIANVPLAIFGTCLKKLMKENKETVKKGNSGQVQERKKEKKER